MDLSVLPTEKGPNPQTRGGRGEATLDTNISEQLPCRSAEVKIFSVFLCQRCREIWHEIIILVKFSVLRFPGFGCAREKFTKIRVKNGKFHPNFTLLRRSAENIPSDKIVYETILRGWLLQFVLKVDFVPSSFVGERTFQGTARGVGNDWNTDSRAFWLGATTWTQTFLSQTFRAPPGQPCKIPGYPAKKFGFPGFRGTYRTFGPHPFTWKTPPHRKKSGLKSFGLGSLLLPDW